MPSKREAMKEEALALVGCGYIYGATGWVCTPKRIEQQAKQYPQYAETIEKYGPKWLGKRCFDCAQLTRTVARRVGVSMPSGATSQWRDERLWSEKDVIDTLPDEAGLFLFTMRDGRMVHTGVSVGGRKEVDARGTRYGVVERDIDKTTFTHWARLAIDYNAPADAPNPEPKPDTRRTLRRGMSGEDVADLQRKLIALGYDVGSYGADGIFGAKTQEAVRKFQRDNGLAVDGIVGRATWAKLDELEPGDEEEPPQAERLILTGDALRVLEKAVAGARMDGSRVSMLLEKFEFDALAKAVKDETAREIE